MGILLWAVAGAVLLPVAVAAVHWLVRDDRPAEPAPPVARREPKGGYGRLIGRKIRSDK